MYYIINVISSGGRRNLNQARARSNCQRLHQPLPHHRETRTIIIVARHERGFSNLIRVFYRLPRHAFRPSPIASVCKTSLPKDYPRTLGTQYSISVLVCLDLSRLTVFRQSTTNIDPRPWPLRSRSQVVFLKRRRRRRRRRAYPNRTLVVRAHTQHTHTCTQHTHACANTILRR